MGRRIARFTLIVAAIASPMVVAAGDATDDAKPAAASVAKLRSGPPTDAERRHWSLQPVADPQPPKVSDERWVRSPIDRFILARLEAAPLAPAPAADKRTLIRRATFDLTGLPPTPEEVGAFLADDSPEAFERVVDRLLASLAYGERWGRHWLDLVRYADTAGETSDYPVPDAYRYRNYVIDSFNADKPYDAFIREQVAGDILAASAPPERYAELVTATGYLAIARRFGSGNDDAQHRHLTIQDAIDNVGMTVLGLTLGCARCHDHKYDPVSMGDYYALYGILDSTRFPRPGGEHQPRPLDMAPLVSPAVAATQKADRDAQLAALDAEVNERTERWAALELEVLKLRGFDGDFEVGDAGQKPPRWWGPVESPALTAEAQSPFTNAYPAGSRGVSLPMGAPNHAVQQPIAPPRKPDTHAALHLNIDLRNTAAPEANGGAYRIYLGRGPAQSPAIELLVDAEALYVREGDQRRRVAAVKTGQWYNLRVSLDLREKKFTATLDSPGESVAFDGRFMPNWDGVIDYFFVDGHPDIQRVKPAHDIDNVALADVPFKAIGEPVTNPPLARDPAAIRDAVAQLTQQAMAAGGEGVEIKKRREALAAEPLYDVAYAVADDKPRNARVHLRGEPRELGDEVPRRFIDVLGGDPLPPDHAGSGRLALADWLTRPNNPLTARVMVNRIWQHHFGAGLVATPSDFGFRGKPPTHPDLLDYLAARFVESGWSVKAMHRLIMNSATYQMSSTPADAAITADPDNALLGRFNRRRLDAESIRDSMLFVAGNLDASPGGPHPFPPINTWAFTQHKPFAAVYPTNRRSVYLLQPRLARHPLLALFDGADTNTSTPQRIETTVPTQALFLMNDPFVHEQSAGLAKRLIEATPDPAARVALAWRLTLSRETTDDESQRAIAFVERYAAAGQPEPDCWAALARTLLIRNEFLYTE